MGNRRFTRETNGFSKKLRNHELSVALHAWHYNFARGHMSLNRNGLEVTPAMKVGLAEAPLSFRWLLEYIDRRWNAKAARPGPSRYRPLMGSLVAGTGLLTRKSQTEAAPSNSGC